MAEELLQFDNTVEDEDGVSHVATVLGTARDDGQWIGWVRFTDDAGHVLETERETTQPNRDDLLYWSTGLTYFFLEGALVRAKRRRDRAAANPPSADAARTAGSAVDGADGPPPHRREAPTAAAAAPGAGAAPSAAAAAGSVWRGVPRLEVLSLSEQTLAELMGTRSPRPGTSREVPDAGVIVYEGATQDGDAVRYRFAVQFGSDNAGGILANWLWSRLHDGGAEVHVNGAAIEMRNDALKRALVGH